jgi:hypothetical protein
MREQKKNNGFASKWLNVICGGVLAIDGDAQGGKAWHLATLSPGNTGWLCNPHPHCQTFQSFLKKISRASPPRLQISKQRK